jgi:sugar lactone lactonase YvrE
MVSESKFIKPMKTRIPSVCHSFGGVVCAGAVLVMAASASAQNLFVSSSYDGNIYEFTPGGVQSTFASGLDQPYGLVFDRAGNLFETDMGSGNIYEFTPGGVQSTFTSEVNFPYALAIDSAGNLFVIGGSGNIYKITPSGVVSLYIPYQSDWPNGTYVPYALAIDSAGSLFVADVGGNNIYKFAPSGVRSTFVFDLYRPYGLAFDSAGNLYVTDGFGDIVKFTPAGAGSIFASGLVNVYSNPVFDSAGNLFVAQYGDGQSNNGSIVEITPGGVQSTFASGLYAPVELAFQPVPVLQGVATNGIFQVMVSMPSPCYSTIIQASTDLVNWSDIYTNTPPFTFTNSMATTFPQCFYRALLGP